MRIFKQKSKPLTLQKMQTIDDVLKGDDVHEFINELAESKAGIKNIIIIYDDAEGLVHHRWSGSYSMLNYMLDSVKHNLWKEL
jgi:hypothetical protein